MISIKKRDRVHARPVFFAPHAFFISARRLSDHDFFFRVFGNLTNSADPPGERQGQGQGPDTAQEHHGKQRGAARGRKVRRPDGGYAHRTHGARRLKPDIRQGKTPVLNKGDQQRAEKLGAVPHPGKIKGIEARRTQCEGLEESVQRLLSGASLLQRSGIRPFRKQENEGAGRQQDAGQGQHNARVQGQGTETFPAPNRFKNH